MIHSIDLQRLSGDHFIEIINCSLQIMIIYDHQMCIYI